MILKASSIIMITTVSIVEAVASRLRQYACMATNLQLFHTYIHTFFIKMMTDRIKT